MKLRIVKFSAATLPDVQDFECGPDDWCCFAERWIKSAPPFSGALRSIQERGNTVWLYFIDALDEAYLVGYSSLGTVRWKIPPPDGPVRDAGFIPMLAVAIRFQGKPVDSRRHYIDQMLEHVIEQARERGYRELCLFVNEDNHRARTVYERHGFHVLGERDAKGNLKMLRLLD